jgi:5'-3' exonuclease
MGIKGLNNLLRKFNIFDEISLSNYAYKKLAIDTSLYVYKYKFAAGERWLLSFVQLIATLRKNEIHCVFIFDSKAPEEKKLEQEKRRETREKDKLRTYELEESLNNFHLTNEIDENLKKLNEKLINDEKRLLPQTRLLENEKVLSFNIKRVENYIDKIKTRNIEVNQDDFDLAKQLFNKLGVPYFMAPQEAECFCSDLCKKGVVDAVLSDDTDVLAYGSPVYLSKINLTTETCTVVSKEVMLDELKLNYEQFLDVCILSGTDYNKNIEGVAVMKAYDIILKYKSIEEFENYINSVDTSKLKKYESNCIGKISEINHPHIRNMFMNYKTRNIKVNYCEKPDWEAVNKFLVENNCNFNINTLMKSFDPPEIILI